MFANCLCVCVCLCARVRVCVCVLIKLIWNDSQISGRVCGFFPQFDFIGLEKQICEAWRPFQSSSYHMHVYTAFFIALGRGRVFFIFILTIPTFSDTTCWPTFEGDIWLVWLNFCFLKLNWCGKNIHFRLIWLTEKLDQPLYLPLS